MKRTLQAMLLALVAIMMPIGAWAQESTAEAKWGTSAQSLTNEGTLAEAFAAAYRYDEEAGSNIATDIAYIQLQSNVTTTDDYYITGGTFTLDLNGHTLTGEGYTLDIRNEGTSVTLVDYSEDAAGKVETTSTAAAAIYVLLGGNLTIGSGSYESASTAVMIESGSSATITGGTFTGAGENFPTISNSGGTLSISGGTFGGTDIQATVHTGGFSASTTITGGTFAEGREGTIGYQGGKLDLSDYPTTATEGTTPLTGISVFSYVAITVGTETLALPMGYCLYNGEQAVTVLAPHAKYTIGAEPDTKYTVTYAANGGSGTMAEDISYGGDYILPECTFTAPEGKMFMAWQVGDTEYQPGEIITVAANTTVTAVWRDYVPQIILKLTDVYGDGWNDAAITVKEDGEEIGTATIPAGGYTATFRYVYDNTSEYTFYWTKGMYDGECSFVIKVENEEVLTATTEDCAGYEDGQLIHTIEGAPIAVESLTIADGELAEYSSNKKTNVGTLTYTRTLPNTEWNALYVPFEVEVTEALLADYEVAYANNMHAYDTDDNGTIDELEMEVIKIKQGTLHANHPYFIRAKSEAARALTLTVEDAVLYATESVAMTCQSFYTTFTLTGTYSAMDAADFAAIEGTHYAIATEGGWWRTEGLNPFRVYMTITEREGSPVKVSAEAMARVRIVTRGEETTGIDHARLEPGNAASGAVYDLQGRRVAHPTQGIYIVNGRKVIF